MAAAAKLSQLSNDAAASTARVRELKERSTQLRMRVERADADAAQRTVLMSKNAQLFMRTIAELKRRIPYAAVADDIAALRGALGSAVRE